MLTSKLANTFWKFGTSTGAVFCSILKFAPEGQILGYSHFNEASWGVIDDKVAIYAQDGNLSILLDVHEGGDGNLSLEGKFLLFDEGSVLRKFDQIDHTETKYPVSFQWSEKFEDFFEEKRIFLAPGFNIRNVIKIGTEVNFENKIIVEPYSTLPHGNFFSMGAFSYSEIPIVQNIEMGRYCSIAIGVRRMGHDHPMGRLSTSTFTYDALWEKLADKDFGGGFQIENYPLKHPVAAKIGHDVWIGEDVILAQGITIGTGAVIATGSIVTKDVPPYAVVGGVPARIIKMRFPDSLVERLLVSEWWKYKYTDLPRNWSDPSAALDEIKRREERNLIQPFSPDSIDIVDEIRKISISSL